MVVDRVYLQDYYREIRSTIVSFMLKNAKALRDIVDPSYKSMENYIIASKMAEDGTWGEYQQLQAFATMFQTPVVVFSSWGWLDPILPVLSTGVSIDATRFHGESIYLILLCDHYEPEPSFFS